MTKYGKELNGGKLLKQARYALPSLGIIALGITGALLQNVYILYGLIFAICGVVILVTFGKLGKEYYPYLLFGIGLALLYQTTLMGPTVVGSDIHSEYYFYLKAVENGWDTSLAHTYNACIGNVILAPFMAKALHIEGVWVFKVIYPFFFAFIPVLLYYIFKKQFGDKVAFLSVFFFIIVPTWSLEMIGLTRQMLGEIVFVVCAFIIIVSSWRLRIKIPILIAGAILGMLFHYVMGPVILGYLGAVTVILAFFKRRTFPIKWMTLTVVILLMSGVGYYGWVCQGVPLRNISGSLSKQIAKINPMPFINTSITSITSSTTEPIEPTVITEPTVPTEPIAPTIPTEPTLPDEKPNLFEKQEPLLRTAFGLDFMEVSPLGKVFRILQFATQLFLILGCIRLFKNRRKYTPEYLSFVGASIILMLACIFLVRFSNIINLTRVYHIMLFFLAPAIILGGLLVIRNLKVLVLCLLIPYFLFTSGFFFEVFKYDDISEIDIPYSIALSHERVDVAAVFTKNDIKVRDWAVENKCEPIFMDVAGMQIFSQKKDWVTFRYSTLKVDSSLFEDGWGYLPRHVDRLPSHCYIFLREMSMQKGIVTFKPNWFDPKDTNTGMRQSYAFQFMGLDKALEEYEIIYKAGDAILLEVK